MAARSWSELSTTQRRAVTALGVAEVALAVTAWVDLARRPAWAVAGSKTRWAGVIAISWVGPILYLTRGRLPRA